MEALTLIASAMGECLKYNYFPANFIVKYHRYYHRYPKPNDLGPKFHFGYAGYFVDLVWDQMLEIDFSNIALT